MTDYVPGQMLGQYLDKSASAAMIYSASFATEVMNITVANTDPAGSNGRFSIFHCDTGRAYSAGNALMFREPLSAGVPALFQAQSPGSGFSLRPGGTIGVMADSGICTFTIYGAVRSGR